MVKIKKVLNSIIYLVTIFILVVPIILEYFSRTKMGVYRYVIAKNIKLEKIMYPQIILFLKVIFIISIILSIIILFKSTNISKINLVIIFILSIIGIFLSITNVVDLKCYYFFLISVLIDIILLYIQLVINKIISQQKKI